MTERFSNLKCPQCGHEQRMKVPKGVCTKFYMCKGCKKMVSSKDTCCVICDYGDIKCDPQHENEKH